jgi:DHA3 family tetracycline resistance protein-like MFS transporter
MRELLALRDFRLLWLGLTVSLLGDGIYLVTIAWQAYQVSNSPSSLAVAGIAWTLPSVVALPFSGALSDRLGRRPLMLASNLLRGGAALAIALLALAGEVQLWQLILLSAVFGLGEALFGPSFTAIVPELVPARLLVKANALEQSMRPMAMQFAGPAVGGVLVAGFGTGAAFAVDAGCLGVAAVSVALLHGGRTVTAHDERDSLLREMREGAGFVRRTTWLWASLLAFSVAVLAFWGPTDVLLPYVIKNDLSGGADGFGLVLASGGAGAILAATSISALGLPRHRLAFCIVSIALSCSAVALYGIVTALWQMALCSALSGAGFAAGLVAWSTLLQSRVPPRLLGRVSSIDWMMSTMLAPVSFALVGPVSSAFGARETLIGAGLAGGAVLLTAFAMVPELREPEPVAA